MKILHITIAGNHADRNGNPLPKIKMIGRQQWTDKAQRYGAWKVFVQQIFLEAHGRVGEPHPFRAMRNPGRYAKPIICGKARMDLKIYWADEHHADPESVFGSIADALFVNDKELDGSFTCYHSPEHKGRVEVKISIPGKP